MDSVPFTTVVLAAGVSQRFKDWGVLKPKGLIDLRFKGHVLSMIEHSAQARMRIGAGWEPSNPVRIAVRTADLETFAKWSSFGMRTRYGFHYIVASTGQADTAQQAVEGIEGAILIVNCDNAFDTSLSVFVDKCSHSGLLAGALVFPTQGETRYGYVSSAPYFESGAEKTPISEWALAGAFYFKNRHVIRSAFEQTKWSVDRERYLSQLFFAIPGLKLAVRIGRDQLHEWGTPQDILSDRTVEISDQDIMWRL